MLLQVEHFLRRNVDEKKCSVGATNDYKEIIFFVNIKADGFWNCLLCPQREIHDFLDSREFQKVLLMPSLQLPAVDQL